MVTQMSKLLIFYFLFIGKNLKMAICWGILVLSVGRLLIEDKILYAIELYGPELFVS